MGDCGQRAMAEQFHPCSDYRPQTGQVETLEAISNQRVGTHQPEGLGGPFEEEMAERLLAHLIPHAGRLPTSPSPGGQ